MALLIGGHPSKHEAFIRFKNKTVYSVAIIWMDDNKEVLYKVLAPKSFVDVNTFAIHTWIFREFLSKSQMIVDGKEIFKAKSWIDEYKRIAFNHPFTLPLRTIVEIEMPVLSLRHLSLLKLINMLRSKDDVTELELPKILQKELTQLFSNKDELTIINDYSLPMPFNI